MNRTTAHRSLAILIITLVAADWLTKLWITNALALDQTWALVDGWLYFVRRQNTGVAFSLFAELPAAWRVPILSTISLVGIALFTGIVRSTPDRLSRLAGAAVIAGAVGNLGDRLLTGGVTDFVLLTFFPYVFNFADAAITVGAAILMVRLAFVVDDGSLPPAVSGHGAA
ncbi:MAG: signal peptidase II [Gemmatimonadota bacterium]